MYEFHRVFCATPWELEAERDFFYSVVGRFNEANAMPQGILYVPVTLMNVRDKRPVQYVVEENIRNSRHFILLLTDDWGPLERNFEEDYLLAQECSADVNEPMREVCLLRKIPRSGGPMSEGLPVPLASFSNNEEFEDCINKLLSAWLASLLAEDRTNGRPATA